MRRATLFVAVLVLTAAPPIHADLVVNGGFEEPIVTTEIWFPTIPGWTKSGASPFVEIQNDDVMTGGAGSFASAEGDQHAELDGYFFSYSLSQILATTPGTQYLVRFAFAARPDYGPSENSLGFYWEGVLVDQLTKSGLGIITPNWTYYTYKLTASSSSTEIRFADLGNSNGAGTLLDAVSVRAIPEPSTFALGLIGILSIFARRIGLGCLRS